MTEIAKKVFSLMAAEANLSYQEHGDPRRLTAELGRALTAANISQLFYDNHATEEAARVTVIAKAIFDRKRGTAQ